VSHESNHSRKYPDEKDSHKMIGNIITAIILGIGRFVYGIFKFLFSIASSIA